MTDVFAMDFQNDMFAWVNETVAVALAVIHLDFSELQVGCLGKEGPMGGVGCRACVCSEVQGKNGFVRDVVGDLY